MPTLYTEFSGGIAVLTARNFSMKQIVARQQRESAQLRVVLLLMLAIKFSTRKMPGNARYLFFAYMQSALNDVTNVVRLFTPCSVMFSADNGELLEKILADLVP